MKLTALIILALALSSNLALAGEALGLKNGMYRCESSKFQLEANSIVAKISLVGNSQHATVEFFKTVYGPIQSEKSLGKMNTIYSSSADTFHYFDSSARSSKKGELRVILENGMVNMHVLVEEDKIIGSTYLEFSCKLQASKE
jgi:hypothetical protein